MSKKLITTICMTAALAAIPVAGADPGPPQQGGGCNMVFGPFFHSPNSNWLNMMVGSAGSANGIAAANMADMQSRFSDLQFCLG
jgi:hypothetical protein